MRRRDDATTGGCTTHNDGSRSSTLRNSLPAPTGCRCCHSAPYREELCIPLRGRWRENAHKAAAPQRPLLRHQPVHDALHRYRHRLLPRSLPQRRGFACCRCGCWVCNCGCRALPLGFPLPFGCRFRRCRRSCSCERPKRWERRREQQRRGTELHERGEAHALAFRGLSQTPSWSVDAPNKTSLLTNPLSRKQKRIRAGNCAAP